MPTQAAHPRFEKLEPALRYRILDAALAEFGRFGYGSASMNRLVKSAGISKGAIFKYFGTKAGLFSYVYNNSLEEVKEQLRSVRDSSPSLPFFERLEKVIRAGLEFTKQKPLSAAIYYRVIYTGDTPHGSRMLIQIQGTSRRFLKTLIEDAMRDGELRSDLDADKTAFILQSVLDRFLQAHYLEFMAPALDIGSSEQTGSVTETDNWICEIIGLFKVGMEK